MSILATRASIVSTSSSRTTAPSSPLQAQKRRVLAFPVLYRSGAPDRIKLRTRMYLRYQSNFASIDGSLSSDSCRLGPPPNSAALVESRMGAVAWGLWPTLRFPSPLIEPDVPISGIRLVWGFLCQGITPFLSSYVIPFFCSTRAAEHSSAPTAYFHRRRAQRRSRTALLQRRRRLVLDGREHGGRLPTSVVGRARIRGEPAIGRDQTRTTLVFG